jgi:hypothetical protein
MIARYLKLAIVLLVIGIIAAYVLLVIIPEKSYETARSIGRDFKEAFQFTPEITVKHTIILNQQTAILELATLSQNFYHRYTWTNTWAGSTKQIDIAGTFEAKCGFDLQEKFSIHLEGSRATVYLPEPKILSVESQGNMTFRDENGYWNWLRDEDRARATNAFITDARRYAERAAFIENSKAATEEKLQALLKPYVNEVTFVYPNVLWIEPGR